MSTAHGLPTAGAGAGRAPRRRQRCGTSTRARPPERVASGAAAAVLLLLACAAWALPGALASDAPAAAGAAGGDAVSTSPVAAADVPLPQLKIQGGVIFAEYTSRIVALPGSKFSIFVDVLNEGPGDLVKNQAVLRVFSVDGASWPDRACGEPGNASILVPALPAHVGVYLPVPGIPAPSVVGKYTLRMFLDADCKVAEGNDSVAIHQATANYEVLDPNTALPTLGLRIYANPNVKAGKKLKFLVRFYNFGAVSSRPGLLAVIVSNHTGALAPSCAGLPEAGGTWTTSTPKASVPAGNFIVLHATVPVPKITGKLALHVIINADCSIAEDKSISPLPHYDYELLTAT